MRERICIEDLGGENFPTVEEIRKAIAEKVQVWDRSKNWFGELVSGRMLPRSQKFIGNEGIEAFFEGVTEIFPRQLYMWVQEDNITFWGWSILIYGDDTKPENRAFIEDLVVKPFGDASRRHLIFLVKDEIQEQDVAPYQELFKIKTLSLDVNTDEEEWNWEYGDNLLNGVNGYGSSFFIRSNFTLTFLLGDPETINRRLKTLIYHKDEMFDSDALRYWTAEKSRTFFSQYIIVPENSGLNVDLLKKDRCLPYIPSVLELTEKNTLRFLYGGKLK